MLIYLQAQTSCGSLHKMANKSMIRSERHQRTHSKIYSRFGQKGKTKSKPTTSPIGPPESTPL
jgi:hypothetical protein